MAPFSVTTSTGNWGISLDMIAIEHSPDRDVNDVSRIFSSKGKRYLSSAKACIYGVGAGVSEDAAVVRMLLGALSISCTPPAHNLAPKIDYVLMNSNTNAHSNAINTRRTHICPLRTYVFICAENATASRVLVIEILNRPIQQTHAPIIIKSYRF